MNLEDTKNPLNANPVTASSMEVIRVLHIDDDENVQMFLKTFVENDLKIKITSVQSAEEALKLIHTGVFDCCVSDYDMPGMDGITLAGKIREISNIPIIIYTGRGSEEIAERAFAAGINDYIRKEDAPAHYQLVSKRIRQAVEVKKAEKALIESEERYRVLVDNSPYAISVTVGDKIVFANRSRAAFAGVDDPKKLIGKSSQLQFSEADQKTIAERMKMRVSEEKLISPFAFQLISENGSVRDVEDYSSEIMYGSEIAVQHMLLDVTEHNMYARRLEALHKNELELIGTDNLDEVAELTLNAIESTLGNDRCGFGIVEGNVLQFHHIRGIEGVIDLPLSGRGISVRAVRTGKTQAVPDIRVDEDYLKGVKSDYRALSEVVVPVRVGGDVVAVLNMESSRLDAYTSEDVKLLEILSETVASAISRIEQLGSISASEDKYQNILDSSLDSVFILSGTKLLYANKEVSKFLGYDDVLELIGMDLMNILPEDEREKIRQRTLSRLRGEPQSDRLEFRVKRKDGVIIEVEASITMTKYEGKPAVLCFARDISERKLYQTKLTRLHGSAEKLAGALTRDEVWDIAIDTVSQILGFDLGGIGVVEGNTINYVRSVGENLPEDWRVDLSKPSITSRAMETGMPQLVVDTGLDPDYIFAPGTVRRGSELASPIMIDGNPIALLNIENKKTSAFTEDDVSLVQILVGQVASAIDRITHGEAESRRRETRQRELIDGMERMSGMVRHDLRGPLQTIQNASYMLRRRPDQVQELTRMIDDGVEYAVRILEDLRNMTKPEALNKVLTNLSDLVEKSLDNSNIPAIVSVEKSLAPLSLEVDQYRIRRVVDNLVKNAVEAMPDGGTLTLKVEAVDGMALLTVMDSGRGITEEVGKNLFTPFYTTKSTGTGLGLAICRQIVEAHGGKVTFESRLGEGTTFTVALPLSPRVSSGEKGIEVYLDGSSHLLRVSDRMNHALSENQPKKDNLVNAPKKKN
jgi:PAS domain S-box-containing protein